MEQPPFSGEFKALTPYAEAILVNLLTVEFPGRQEVAHQVATAHARPLDDHGCLELRAASGAPRAEVIRRIPVEAEAPDVDGMTIHILLHVVDGYVDELEFFRDDGRRLQGRVQPDALKVFVY